MAEPSDPLARALELSRQFKSSGSTDDVETFLCRHEGLRDLLEPMLLPDTEPELPDAREFGEYELLRELGSGGMGVVFEARQPLIGRTVALKLLPPHRAWSSRSLAMFRREATLAASLDHPGIAKVYSLEEIDGQLALAMECIDGATMERVLDALPAQPASQLTGADFGRAVRAVAPDAPNAPDRAADRDPWAHGYIEVAVELTRQVAEALAHAHARGVVHRDVKPGNIMLTGDGMAVLTDFGLAREEGLAGRTRTGEFAGTYQYAAPEQLAGRQDEIDGRTDVYALGVTLYELLTLRRPFDADSLLEFCARIEIEEPQLPSRINPKIGRDLEAVVLHALEKDREQRYPSARELAQDLGNILARRPVQARHITRLARTARWVRRNPVATSVIATLAAAVALVAWFWADASASRQRYERLWTGPVIEAIEERAERAHPAWPCQQAELAELVQQLQRVLPLREVLERAVTDLRTGHVGTAPLPRDVARMAHPATARIAELSGLRRKLEVELAVEVADHARAEAEQEIRQIDAEVAALSALEAASNRVRIENPGAAALHDRLEVHWFHLRGLAADLLPDLKFRLEWAGSIVERTLAHRAAWQQAAERLRTDPRFAGVVLTPQLGLVPLGRDPLTKLEEFAHLLSGKVPQRGSDGRLALAERDTEHAMVFVLMPGSTGFRPIIEGTREGDLFAEKPITMAPFFIAKHELNRAQWRRIAHGTPGLRLRDGGLADVRNMGELWKPAHGVSWTMCTRLLRRCGLELPTAAQWEYAARFGGGPPAEVAKLAAMANLTNLRTPYRGGLAPVVSMAPSAAGLHHLFGNVKEWCRDVRLKNSSNLGDGDGRRLIAAWPGAPRTISGPGFLTPYRSNRQPLHLLDRAAPDARSRDTGLRAVRRLFASLEEHR
ncbi:MAG: protein kinase [Planctomycetes bacterium]|nr:protein kinase [Planctomycetota bacterium]